MPDQELNNGWSKLTKLVVGLTGVLLVIPSLINSAKDIYNSINEIPRSDSERLNVELFKKYWGKTPIGELPLLISRGGANYMVSFKVYDEGDVYMQYGNRIQWFAFPSSTGPSISKGAVIPTAEADDSSYRPIDSMFRPIQQIDSFEGGNAISEKLYINGIRERQVIDLRTGRIVNQTIRQAPVPQDGVVPKNTDSFRIDLNAPDPKFELIR